MAVNLIEIIDNLYNKVINNSFIHTIFSNSFAFGFLIVMIIIFILWTNTCFVSKTTTIFLYISIVILIQFYDKISSQMREQNKIKDNKNDMMTKLADINEYTYSQNNKKINIEDIQNKYLPESNFVNPNPIPEIQGGYDNIDVSAENLHFL